jgi:hypothetical protein
LRPQTTDERQQSLETLRPEKLKLGATTGLSENAAGGFIASLINSAGRREIHSAVGHGYLRNLTGHLKNGNSN